MTPLSAAPTLSRHAQASQRSWTESNGVRTVIVEDASRFARDLGVLHQVDGGRAGALIGCRRDTGRQMSVLPRANERSATGADFKKGE
jgi:hypothetical protein